MTTRAIQFKELHVKGNPLILFNIWDAGSAQAIQEIGAKAIATGSWAVAVAHGFKDGEQLPLDLVIANLQRIVTSIDLPVTVDLESGYGRTPDEVGASIRRVIEAGAVGVNFEDQVIGENRLYSIDEQCARIAAARQAADIPFFINARTDIFLKTPPVEHNDQHVDDAVQRAHAYAQAGASGFFVPGLRKAEYIKKVCDVSPLPVNILTLPDTPPSRQLAELGVARISYGAGPYRAMIQTLKEAGRAALALE